MRFGPRLGIGQRGWFLNLVEIASGPMLRWWTLSTKVSLPVTRPSRRCAGSMNPTNHRAGRRLGGLQALSATTRDSVVVALGRHPHPSFRVIRTSDRREGLIDLRRPVAHHSGERYGSTRTSPDERGGETWIRRSGFLVVTCFGTDRRGLHHPPSEKKQGSS
jgi:hypothetical protein